MHKGRTCARVAGRWRCTALGDKGHIGKVEWTSETSESGMGCCNTLEVLQVIGRSCGRIRVLVGGSRRLSSGGFSESVCTAWHGLCAMKVVRMFDQRAFRRLMHVERDRLRCQVVKRKGKVG